VLVVGAANVGTCCVRQTAAGWKRQTRRSVRWGKEQEEEEGGRQGKAKAVEERVGAAEGGEGEAEWSRTRVHEQSNWWV